MYGTYASLAQCRAEIDVLQNVTGTAAQTVNNNKVMAMLAFITARINTMVGGYEFLPRRTAVYFDALGQHIDDYDFTMQLSNTEGLHPLLSVTTLVDGQGTTLVEGTDFYPYPRGVTPILYLRTIESSGKNWSLFSNGWQDAIVITGVYGWRKRYSEAWVSSGDAITSVGGINTSATAFTVTDADGNNALGTAPRFSAGNLIQVESEWMSITATDIVTNTLTVIRGVRGTTTAIHAQSTAISVFAPESDIVRACVRWAAYLYARMGAFEQTSFDGVATVSFPPDAPTEVANILRPYTDIRWVAV